MSSNPRYSTPPSRDDSALEARLRRAAAAFPYPPAPDLAARERAARERAAQKRRGRAAGEWAGSAARRLALGLAVLLILALAALLASPVRARVLDWIRIGSVRIFFTPPTATPLPPTATPVPSGTPTSIPTRTPLPSATPTPLTSVLNLSGETTLAEAQAQAGYTIQMPTYPADLGPPQHVFLQAMSGPVVVLVWVDPNRPEKVRLSLSESASDQLIFEKYNPKSVQDTQVAGQPAVWMDGEYLLVTRNGDSTLTRLITQGHTLIWSTGKRTFRLETDMDLAEALKMAESIR